MPTSALVVAVVVVAIVSRLLDVYLWRAGRISDRTAAILLLGRFPIVGLLYSLIIGASVQVMARDPGHRPGPGFVVLPLCG